MAKARMQEAKLNHPNTFTVSTQKWHTSCLFTFHWPKPIIQPNEQCDRIVHAAVRGMGSYKTKGIDLKYMGTVVGKNNIINHIGVVMNLGYING